MISDDEAKDRIAWNVRRLLEERGWSQHQLAVAVNTNDMAISYLLRAKRMPGAAFLARVAEALGTAVDDLLAEIPKKFRQPA